MSMEVPQDELSRRRQTNRRQPTRGGSSSDTEEPPKLKAACLSCKGLKIRCSRDQPCERCARLGIDCIPQERGRGRPKKHVTSPKKNPPTPTHTEPDLRPGKRRAPESRDSPPLSLHKPRVLDPQLAMRDGMRGASLADMHHGLPPPMLPPAFSHSYSSEYPHGYAYRQPPPPLPTRSAYSYTAGENGADYHDLDVKGFHSVQLAAAAHGTDDHTSPPPTAPDVHPHFHSTHPHHHHHMHMHDHSSHYAQQPPLQSLPPAHVVKGPPLNGRDGSVDGVTLLASAALLLSAGHGHSSYGHSHSTPSHEGAQPPPPPHESALMHSMGGAPYGMHHHYPPPPQGPAQQQRSHSTSAWFESD